MPKRENPFGWSTANDVLQPKETDDIEAKKAVALLYDQVRAPILVAKGQGAFAEEIIEVAKAAGVHLAEDPVLAETQIGRAHVRTPVTEKSRMPSSA